MGCKGLISGLFEEGESVFQGRQESLSDFWIVSWFISQNEGERGFLGQGVSSGVVCEFCHWDKVGPLIGLSLAEQSEICFYFLVDPFSLPICLWMIGGRQFEIVSQDLGKFGGES